MKSLIIGVDEVGRGPLAGPVTVAASIYPASLPAVKAPLRDSKQLSPAQRAEWARSLRKSAREGRFAYAIRSVSARSVDRLNISRAANRAATKAVSALIRKFPPAEARHARIFLDGGLHLEKKLAGSFRFPPQTVVKGDEQVPAIALASILAKVHRDRLMETAEKRIPGYGFSRHKGYGTREHQKALKRRGPSPAHRLTFIGNFVRIQKN
jgi:ribonuclease HII